MLVPLAPANLASISIALFHGPARLKICKAIKRRTQHFEPDNCFIYLDCLSCPLELLSNNTQDGIQTQIVSRFVRLSNVSRSSLDSCTQFWAVGDAFLSSSEPARHNFISNYLIKVEMPHYSYLNLDPCKNLRGSLVRFFDLPLLTLETGDGDADLLGNLRQRLGQHEDLPADAVDGHRLHHLVRLQSAYVFHQTICFIPVWKHVT